MSVSGHSSTEELFWSQAAALLGQGDGECGGCGVRGCGGGCGMREGGGTKCCSLEGMKEEEGRDEGVEREEGVGVRGSPDVLDRYMCGDDDDFIDLLLMEGVSSPHN